MPKGFSVTPFDNKSVARLYSTNIVVIDYNLGLVTLNSGGWTTNHTKKCMNLVLDKLGYKVYQEAFQWYVGDSQGNVTEFKDGLQLPLLAKNCQSA